MLDDWLWEFILLTIISLTATSVFSPSAFRMTLCQSLLKNRYFSLQSKVKNMNQFLLNKVKFIDLCFLLDRFSKSTWTYTCSKEFLNIGTGSKGGLSALKSGYSTDTLSLLLFYDFQLYTVLLRFYLSGIGFFTQFFLQSILGIIFFFL